MTDEKKKEFPKAYNHQDAETKWQKNWEESGIYKWNPDIARKDTYIVDTPPPTVSGSLHVGHAFSYAQTDVLVRYQRMKGKNIFYPMGWDDNGLPTERRAQNVYNISCDPYLPHNPNWKPDKQKKSKDNEPVSRLNFIKACEMVTAEDEKAFESTWRKLGLSVDWTQIYTTIGDHCRKISQLSFVELAENGLAYSTEAITMWDVDFRTAVSQAEVEDRDMPGAYHDLRFGLEGGGEFIISTTRPELLAACIAVAAHPDDERYKNLFGKNAITPLFKVRVPIVASEHADPGKGSGILMICTFGDLADVEWWKKSKMPIRQVIGLDGRIIPITFGEGVFSSLDPEAAQNAYDQIADMKIKAAKDKIVELLAIEGSGPDGKGTAMIGSPKPVTHPIRFYEKGNKPLEFIPTRQWFIKILEFKDQLLRQGEKIQWHPSHMKTRYDHWVMGLNQEWCISRQRYFGVPIPVWYPVLENGLPNYDHPIFPDKNSLPVDPITDVPAGYYPEQRDIPGGFTGDGDVMDTWATSSLTPQISSYWGVDQKRHPKLFPADLRPQAHDIIRTWAFYTIVKSWLHHKEIPWKHAAISGFILDPDRKKMSKSKGNVLTPESLLDEHSSDVFRYWASKGRLGTDSSFDQTQFKIGRKLVIKIFNASKFVLGQLDDAQIPLDSLTMDSVCTECDRSWIALMKQTINEATQDFENYEYTTALQAIEDRFWNFCDHYLEMVKVKAYDAGNSPESRSALATLNWSLKTFLRLFAPFMPYLTEEIWSWRYDHVSPSIHNSSWPSGKEVSISGEPVHEKSLERAIEVISLIRGYKTINKASQRIPVVRLEIIGSRQDLDSIELMLPYIKDSAVSESDPILTVETIPAEQGYRFKVNIELGEYTPISKEE